MPKTKRKKSLVGWIDKYWQLSWGISQDFWAGEADLATHPFIIRNKQYTPDNMPKVKIRITLEEL